MSADCDETARVAWGGLARKRAVAEFIRPDDQYRACLEDRDARKAFAHWQRPVAEGGLGGRTVQDRICDLVVTGKVDFEDASHLSLDTLLGRGGVMAGTITLKWGTLKSCYGLDKTARDALQKFSDLGLSQSAMVQKMTPAHINALCDAIDLVDEPIIDEWSGKELTREEAKQYVHNYSIYSETHFVDETGEASEADKINREFENLNKEFDSALDGSGEHRGQLSDYDRGYRDGYADAIGNLLEGLEKVK